MNEATCTKSEDALRALGWIYTFNCDWRDPVTGEDHPLSTAIAVIEHRTKYIYRISDGDRFTKGEDGLFRMDSPMMAKPYAYSYETLINVYTGSFTTNKNACQT